MSDDLLRCVSLPGHSAPFLCSDILTLGMGVPHVGQPQEAGRRVRSLFHRLFRHRSASLRSPRPLRTPAVPVAVGDERQNPVRRPERRRTSAMDLADQIRVAQRPHSERRWPYAGAPEERAQPRVELLLQRLHARNGEDPFAGTSNRGKCPKIRQCIWTSRKANSLRGGSASGMANAPGALVGSSVKGGWGMREAGAGARNAATDA